MWCHPERSEGSAGHVPSGGPFRRTSRSSPGLAAQLQAQVQVSLAGLAQDDKWPAPSSWLICLLDSIRRVRTMPMRPNCACRKLLPAHLDDREDPCCWRRRDEVAITNRGEGDDAEVE